MKEWADKVDLVALVSQARREARDHGPRMSNDELEAAMFLAMAFAMSKYFEEQEAKSQQSGVDQAGVPDRVSEPPQVVSEDEPVVETATEPQQEEADADPFPAG